MPPKQQSEDGTNQRHAAEQEHRHHVLLLTFHVREEEDAGEGKPAKAYDRDHFDCESRGQEHVDQQQQNAALRDELDELANSIVFNETGGDGI